MTKSILILSTVLLLSISFALVGDIFPQHQQGFFINIASIGYSLGTSEFETAPLSDLMGIYNFAYRNYFMKNSISQFSVTYYNVNQLLIYAGETPDWNLGIWNVELYNHSNFFIGKISIKPHVSINAAGLHFEVTNSSTKIDAFAIYTKDFIQLGYYVDNDKEAFATLEGGKLFSIITKPEITDTDYKKMVDDAKSKSLYLTARVGLKWYFNPQSIFEIGYRFPVIKSSFSVIQGYGFLNYPYNYLSLINETSEEDVFNIPWITTNYYINFSMSF